MRAKRFSAANLATAVALALALSNPSSAQTDAGVRAADSIVASWVAADRIPGAVLWVSKDGAPAFQRAYGSARRFEYGTGEYGAAAEGRPTAAGALVEIDVQPMTTGTLFDLASVTKVMATTFAVMILVDEGLLHLDAPLTTYLPDFTGGGKEAVTARHLLTHTAGLAQWQPVYYHASSPDEAYTYIRDLPLEWSVGEGRHYSDLGFMLLGRLVERVAGQPMESLLDERLYGPLDRQTIGFRPTSGERGVGPNSPIAATSHGNPYEHRMVYDSTFGYRYPGDPAAWDGWRHRTLVGEVNDGNAYHAFGGRAGHAGLFATAADLGVLLELLLGRGEHRGRRLLSSEVVDLFLSPATDGQALGWQVPSFAADGFTHTGFTGTFVLGIPDLELAVVLLTNRQHGGVGPNGGYTGIGDLQAAVARALGAPGR